MEGIGDGTLRRFLAYLDEVLKNGIDDKGKVACVRCALADLRSGDDFLGNVRGLRGRWPERWVSAPKRYDGCGND